MTKVANNSTKKTVLLLGSNLGDRTKMLQNAINDVAANVGDIVEQSSIYETAAWGNTEQANFLNQIIIVNCDLSPLPLLKMIKKIEQEMGRKPNGKWNERIIDIDILFMEDIIIDSNELTIPHKYFHKRRFALVPCAEIAPNFMHPIFNTTVKELLFNCEDEQAVEKYGA